MASQVTWNQSFFNGILMDPRVVHETQKVAQAAAARARATAPVDTGAYKRSIQVVRVQARYRIVFLVIAMDSKGLLIESKVGNLGRALRAVVGRG